MKDRTPRHSAGFPLVAILPSQHYEANRNY